MAQRTLLLEENPLVVQPSLAVALGGLNEAIVLQQVHYWLNSSKHSFDNRKWIYNSMPEWGKQFPFWSEKTVARTFKSLINMGLIITENFNQYRIDKTLWYTIDYSVLELLIEEQSKQANPADPQETDESIKEPVKEEIPDGQIVPMEEVNLPIPCGQNDLTIHPKSPDHTDKMGVPIPETTTETTTKSNISLSSQSSHNQSKDNKGQERPERQPDAKSLRQGFEDIVKQCKLDEVCENAEIKSTIRQALQYMFYNTKFSKKTLGITLDIMRESLKSLNSDIIKYALKKMQKEIAYGREIQKPVAYLQSCIYHSIAEYQANNTLNDQVLAQQELDKAKQPNSRVEHRENSTMQEAFYTQFMNKFIGTEFENPMLDLARESTDTALKLYFSNMKIVVDRSKRLLKLVVEDDFTAGIIEARYKNKVLEKFKKYGIAVDSVEVDFELTA